MEMSLSVCAPPPPSPLQFLHPHSSYLWDVRLTKKYVSFDASAHVSLRVHFKIWLSPLWRIHPATKKSCLWYLKRNRLIDIYCIVTLIPRSLPGQFVIRSLLTARNSVGCHGSSRPLLLLLFLLLECLNEAGGDIGGLPLCDWLCRRLPRTTASRGIPLLCGWSQHYWLWLHAQCHLVLLVRTDGAKHTAGSVNLGHIQKQFSYSFAP